MTIVSKFKKIANVTLPLLKIKPGVEYYVKFLGAMHLGKEVAGKQVVDPKTGEIKVEGARERPHIAFVKNLETGEDCQIICSKVFRDNLNECYAGESYVGKCFGFVITKVDGKNYNLASIWEVAEPDDDVEETVIEDLPVGKKKK